MSQTKVATPFVSGLTWVLHAPLIEAVPVQRADGQQGLANVQKEPGLSLVLTPFIGSAKLADETYQFPVSSDSQPSVDEILAEAGQNVPAVWESAIRTFSNQFEILDDGTPPNTSQGPAYLLRLDVWKARFDPKGSSAVTAIYGVYTDENFDKPRGYVEIVFADRLTLIRRNRNLSNLAKNITSQQQVLADPSASAEDKETATEQLFDLQNNLADMQSQHVGALSELYAVEGIPESIASLMVGIFSTLKTINPKYVDLDIETFIQRFQTTFGTIVNR